MNSVINNTRKPYFYKIINNNKLNLLILDIDNTILSSQKIDNYSIQTIYRPYVLTFLKKVLNNNYGLVIFTLGSKEYVENCLSNFFPEFILEKIILILCRNEAIIINNILCKDLYLVRKNLLELYPDYRDKILNKIIKFHIVDDLGELVYNCHKCDKNEYKFYNVLPYHGDQDDKFFLNFTLS